MARPTVLTDFTNTVKTSCIFSPISPAYGAYTVLMTARHFIPWTLAGGRDWHLNANLGSDVATGSGTALDSTKSVVPRPREFDPASNKDLYLVGVTIQSGFTIWGNVNRVFAGEATGSLALIDILVGATGLSSTSTSTQTINTVSLPRHTDGIGVRAALISWGSAGGSGTINTVNYTVHYLDENGNSKTSTFDINGAAQRGFNQSFAATIPLISQGITQVVDYTADVSMQTSISDYGVILYKPLASWGLKSPTDPLKCRIFPTMIGFPKIDFGQVPLTTTDHPCLGLMYTGSANDAVLKYQIEFEWLIV